MRRIRALSAARTLFIASLKMKSANPVRGIASFNSRSVTPHRLPHILTDSSIYFITGRTYAGINWLQADSTKKYFQDKLQELVSRFNFGLDAYAILNNHYHVLVAVPSGENVPKFVKNLHGATAHYIKQNMPDLVNGEQMLSKEKTAFDIRQERRLKSATPLGGLAKFISRQFDTE